MAWVWCTRNLKLHRDARLPDGLKSHGLKTSPVIIWLAYSKNFFNLHTGHQISCIQINSDCKCPIFRCLLYLFPQKVPCVEWSPLQDLVSVAVEEDEVVPHQVYQDLSDQLTHVHAGNHLLKDLLAWKIEMNINKCNGTDVLNTGPPVCLVCSVGSCHYYLGGSNPLGLNQSLLVEILCRNSHCRAPANGYGCYSRWRKLPSEAQYEL